MSIDVRELLGKAAAKPASVLDVAALARTPRHRRTVRAACAVAATAAIVILGVVVVSLPGVDRRGVQTPLRPVPSTVPDVSKTHAIVVTPSTRLRDGQPIRLSGRHFVVGVNHVGGVNAIYVATCRAGATPSNFDQQCDRRTSAGTAQSDIRSRTLLRKAKPGQPPRANCCVDMAGYQYTAVRHLNLPGGPVDCALESCVVIALGFDSGYGIVPLRFDPELASLPTPRVTVTPNTDLRDGEQVTIHIEDAWPRSTPVTMLDGTTQRAGIDNRFGQGVSLCAVSGVVPVCNDTDLGVDGVWPIANHGRVDLTMTVRSTVLSAGYGAGAPPTARVADCAQPPGCVIRVQVPTGPLEGQTAQLAAPITFSSDVSARPLADRLPQATIDPAGPYTDGQQVTITANGLPKGTAVSQCAKPDLQPGGAGALRLLFSAPESVTATGALVLHRFIDGLGSDPIDCAEPGHCALYLRTADPNHEGMLGHGPLLEFTPLTVS